MNENTIKLAKCGDVLHQDLLYKTYKKKLTGYIKNYYDVKEEDVEDIVSEILVKVFLGLKNFNEKKSIFNTWVINIAKNHMVDLWRKNEISMVYNDDYYSDDNSVATIDIDFKESYRDRHDFLKNLTINECELLEMKYEYGFTYEDIGLYTQMSASTIANKVNYIKTKIKPHIE